ncbi:hypothetical protein ACFPIK_08905 [Algoriphagus aquatilis]|uniref:Uncharacterized protein n=1 Tax=Algoriphagus aquatilis TaxID=490186 RepID=A0ABW0BWZ3_9BACT
MITNPDTEEPIACPYCESEENCEHLFALYDVTFDSLDGGYIFDKIDLEELLTEFFISQINKCGYPANPLEFENETLQALWEEILYEDRCNFNAEKNEWEIDIPNYNLLLFEVLDDLIYPEYGEFEGGPGQTSSYRIYYTENPEEDLNSLIKRIKALLEVCS